ncbi:MAG: hypothetical protein K6G90_03960 [Clostridia bacterium]|nr:hypothetical protein [Clostridia bacterium]
MTTFKKTLSALLAAIMILCAMSVATVAFAEDVVYYVDGNFKFAVIGEDGAETARIVKLNPKAGNSIVLPVSVTIPATDDSEAKTYLVSEVAEGVFAPEAEGDALENDIIAVSIEKLMTDPLADYDVFVNAYKDAFKDIDTVLYFYIPYVLKDFAKDVKTDAAAALSAADISSPEQLVDYIAASYYKYTTAVCDALGLDYITAYVPVSAMSDEVVSANNGVLYTGGVSTFYINAREALDVTAIPTTLLVVPKGKTEYAVNSGTERISGYAFTNRTVDKLGIPESVKTFGKGTYAEGDAAPAEHNTFDTATVKYVENRSKEFTAIEASGLIKAGIEVYSVDDFGFKEYVEDNGGTYTAAEKTRIEEASSVLQRLAEFFSKIVTFFKQLLERIKG